MPDPPNSIDTVQAERVFTELGRCVALYQTIERNLKYLLPHVLPVESKLPAKGEGFANWRVFLDSPTTLGSLVRKLADRNKSTTAKVVTDHLITLATHRNEIIHHWHEQPFWRLNSQAECEAALRFLAERHGAAMPLLEFLDSALEILLDEFRKLKVDSETQNS